MVLGIETTDLLCSVAFVDNNQVLVEFNHEIPKKHAVLIGTLVEKGGIFLSECNLVSKNFIDDLELIAVAIGPGSFTGLRIGLSYAQGLCLAKNIPIIGINNHQVLAESCPYNYSSVFTIIDARRDEVYLAKMRLNKNKYYEIESHSIINKKNLVDEIPENSALVYNINTELDNSITKTLIKKQINIVNSARYSAALTARIGFKQYKLFGEKENQVQKRRSFRLPTKASATFLKGKLTFTCTLDEISHIGFTARGDIFKHLSMNDFIMLKQFKINHTTITLDLLCRIARKAVDFASNQYVAGLQIEVDNSPQLRKKYFDEIYYPTYLNYLKELSSFKTMAVVKDSPKKKSQPTKKSKSVKKKAASKIESKKKPSSAQKRKKQKKAKTTSRTASRRSSPKSPLRKANGKKSSKHCT